MACKRTDANIERALDKRKYRPTVMYYVLVSGQFVRPTEVKGEFGP